MSQNKTEKPISKFSTNWNNAAISKSKNDTKLGEYGENIDNGSSEEETNDVVPKTNFPPTFDSLFKKIKNYGCYQIYFFVCMQYMSVPQAGNVSGSYMSLGGLIPEYTCSDNGDTIIFDRTNITKNATEACRIISNCRNLTVENNNWYSMYEEFRWVCIPSHLLTTVASITPITAVFGYLIGGHLADHLGRKWLAFTGLCITIFGGLGCALSPNWQFYLALTFLKGLTSPIFYGSAFALCMESVGNKWRLMQSFSFQWSLAYTLAGIIAFITGNWRLYYAVVNGLAIPGLFMYAMLEESPRYLVQKFQFKKAAKVVNRIAKWNRRRDIKFTAGDMKAIEIGSRAEKHHYNILHLFSQRKMALYCVSQMFTGVCINMVYAVLMYNVQDLAGSPFLNISLMGVIRLWAPVAVLLMEKYSGSIGRKSLMIGSQGIVCLCFTTMVVIYATGNWQRLHQLATGCAYFGYGVEIGLVWVAYKTFTTELFPTVIRTIALNTFSLASLLGTSIAPQLIYLRHYWHPLPYAGAALISLLSVLIALLILPETRNKPMPDSLEEVKCGRLARIDTDAVERFLPIVNEMERKMSLKRKKSARSEVSRKSTASGA